MSGDRPGLLDYTLLTTLALLWGSAFLLSKVAVAEVTPITITLIRQVISAVMLFAFAIAARRWFRPTARDHVFMIVCALAGTVAPFTLINWGVEVIDSGLAAILMGFMPLTVLVLAHFVTRDERMTLPKFLGVALGLVGLAILFWPQLQAGFGQDLFRQLAMLGAAFAYAINALSMKPLVGRPPMALMAYITAWTLVILLPAAFLFEQPLAIAPSPTVTVALLAMGTLPSAVGALIMAAIIRRQGAAFFGQINLLVPVAGVVLAVVFLGERPGPHALLALGVIFAGLLVARFKPFTRTPIAQESHP
ncbi:DMT family transporter [Oricola sp.]|uniref:DMT family transporter n=1 Tax=Oricola sp. TaxID=1979950 RepID=UPI0025CEC2C7|nr:DMT family transporter [Oricola sp.]MCI5075698.1 DMT family transporter [Oricola sp.]